MGIYSFTGAPVFVTVGATGVYDINAFGAQGGTGTNTSASATYTGGLGAEAGGTVTLTTGETLEIVVGGQGSGSLIGSARAGGGGGTFVFANTGAGGTYVPVLVAGGGGGAYATSNGAGGAGSVGPPGAGGGGAIPAGTANGGGGGAGVNGPGGTGTGDAHGGGGTSRAGNFAGGTNTVNARYSTGPGGFGGGGGGGGAGGGGGGGYTGGAGGYYAGGGGGTSFVAGTATANATQTMAGVQSGNGSLSITQAVPCYCPGTLILTNRGEVPVEVLAIGDTVVTASGAHRPIRWIGRRSYAGRFLAASPGMQPILFRAGSLGGGLPRRDLLVSPKHAMVLNGMLVPAECLVNGSTILREGRRPRVDYYHVELDSHDVLLAEGAPSESYVDDDSRGMFHNAAEFAARYPVAGQPAAFCLPRVEAGFELAAIQQRLANLADPARQAA